MMTKYTLKPTTKRKYYRDSTMSKAEIMLIMILFHDKALRSFLFAKNEKLTRFVF
jgi:hypothetical protein